MYQFKEKYVLNFTEVKHLAEMHLIIKKELDFPEYYGCNWDALWDCLGNMIGRPINIEITGFDAMENRFEDSAKKLLEILTDLKHCDDDAYKEDIQIYIIRANTRISIE